MQLVLLELKKLVPVEIVKKINKYMFCNYNLMDDELNDALAAFKGDVPDDYFNGGDGPLMKVMHQIKFMHYCCFL